MIGKSLSFENLEILCTYDTHIAFFFQAAVDGSTLRCRLDCMINSPRTVCVAITLVFVDVQPGSRGRRSTQSCRGQLRWGNMWKVTQGTPKSPQSPKFQRSKVASRKSQVAKSEGGAIGRRRNQVCVVCLFGVILTTACCAAWMS